MYYQGNFAKLLTALIAFNEVSFYDNYNEFYQSSKYQLVSNGGIHSDGNSYHAVVIAFEG
jgi:hypothetical protein